MLSLINVNKSYYSKQVIFDVNFSIWKWEIVWLLWPNWAWKSTTLKIASWFMYPDSWEILVSKKDLFSDNNLKRNIWYLPETNPLYDDMWVDEFLYFTAELKQIKNIDNEVQKVLKLVWLESRSNNFINTLSKWYKQRTWLAAALIWNPDILILDEPTEWLDPAQRWEMRKLILDLWKNKTIIISSHVLTELADIVSRVLIISEGKIKLDDKIENITNKHWNKTKMIIVYTWKVTQVSLKNEFNWIEISVVHDWDKNKLEIISDTDIREQLFAFMIKNDANILEFYTEKVSLEDVFFETINS